MIITIDGPAGTGKTTVSQAAARRLGFEFLDTGAMYRALALAAMRAGADFADQAALVAAARAATVDFKWNVRPPAVTLDGEPIEHLIRTSAMSQAASKISALPEVRALLVAQQQRIGRERPNIVTEGRDQGSVVFPHARLKFYLDATPRERARRRANQLRQKGQEADETALLAEIMERDHRDSTRAVGPLSVPSGAEVIDTTPLTEEQVIELIVSRANAAANTKDGE